MNKYHHRLNIPVALKFPDYTIDPEQKSLHTLRLKDINSEIHDWFDSLGLYITTAEYFYTPPYSSLGPHSDTLGVSDVVKLNWMKGGKGSLMDWYELRPGKNVIHQVGKTQIKSSYSLANSNDLKKIYSAEIGFPSLVNVGRFHGIRNKDEPRFIAALIPHDKQTKKRIAMSEATDIFRNFLV